MKTSLLLIGLLAGAGIVGTAQAAGATECTHSLGLEDHALASASSVRHGMLSEVASVVSEHLTKSESGNTASSSNDAGGPGQVGPNYPGQPGPVPATATRNPQGDGTRRGTSASMDMHTGGNPSPAPASSDNPPTLGWQSLLPGSIQ